MKHKIDEINDTITLALKETEFYIILGALRTATSDDARKGLKHVNFYGADKGEVVALCNAVQKIAWRKLS